MDEVLVLMRRDQTVPHGLFRGKANSVKMVSESGLFKLISRSDKEAAKPFQDWVTRDVLPSIRKSGGYVLGQEDAKTPEEKLAVLQSFYDRAVAR